MGFRSSSGEVEKEEMVKRKGSTGIAEAYKLELEGYSSIEHSISSNRRFNFLTRLSRSRDISDESK